MSAANDNRQREYWNTIATKVSDNVAASHWVDESDRPISEQMFCEIADFLIDRLVLDAASGVALEIGCGNSLLLSELAHRLPLTWALHGVDISDEMLRRARGSRAVLAQAQADDLPFPAQKFDLIFMHGVVQYFGTEDYMRRVLTEAMRVLKPGAHLCLLDVPSAWHRAQMSQRSFPKKVLRKLQVIGSGAWARFIRLRHVMQVRGGYQFEQIGGVRVLVPTFPPYYPDPDLFFSYGGLFKRVTVEVQPFRTKPLAYRRFRYNVVFETKTVI